MQLAPGERALLAYFPSYSAANTVVTGEEHRGQAEEMIKCNGGMDINMSDEQKDLDKITELVHGEQEVPFLSPKWLNVLESDYIDVYDDALNILEDAPQINAAEVIPHNNR